MSTSQQTQKRKSASNSSSSSKKKKDESELRMKPLEPVGMQWYSVELLPATINKGPPEVGKLTNFIENLRKQEITVRADKSIIKQLFKKHQLVYILILYNEYLKHLQRKNSEFENFPTVSYSLPVEELFQFLIEKIEQIQKVLKPFFDFDRELQFRKVNNLQNVAHVPYNKLHEHDRYYLKHETEPLKVAIVELISFTKQECNCKFLHWKIDCDTCCSTEMIEKYQEGKYYDFPLSNLYAKPLGLDPEEMDEEEENVTSTNYLFAVPPINDDKDTEKDNSENHFLKKENAELEKKLAESNRLQNHFASESAKKSKEIEDLKMRLEFKTVESNQKSKYLSQIFNDIVSHSKYVKPEYAIMETCKLVGNDRIPEEFHSVLTNTEESFSIELNGKTFNLTPQQRDKIRQKDTGQVFAFVFFELLKMNIISNNEIRGPPEFKTSLIDQLVTYNKYFQSTRESAVENRNKDPLLKAYSNFLGIPTSKKPLPKYFAEYDSKYYTNNEQ
ncbi:predicted protein [Naegleria gruberi]|uniref:Predicted protein n=1 Tax=Naegleria gruberi TaxID=5762 RepID=D2W4M3_NAEGR|nr:uncharacterized protein NAEGRDRAFT_54639 [Naegleria gruberi]EFC35979.1 predicted protein [Naegleria gruberi]|eukprot:XP_002668723.1 predicted protein [Naegleria gruberi strain NEG-M]